MTCFTENSENTSKGATSWENKFKRLKKISITRGNFCEGTSPYKHQVSSELTSDVFILPDPWEARTQTGSPVGWKDHERRPPFHNPMPSSEGLENSAPKRSSASPELPNLVSHKV